MLVLSTTIGALTGLVGMYLSYHLDISSGPCIVLVNFAVFTVVYAATGVQGLRLSIGVRRYAPNLQNP
jgi:ABC-type Mn2+/Zn2+ transport system permease subunit